MVANSRDVVHRAALERESKTSWRSRVVAEECPIHLDLLLGRLDKLLLAVCREVKKPPGRLGIQLSLVSAKHPHIGHSHNLRRIIFATCEIVEQEYNSQLQSKGS